MSQINWDNRWVEFVIVQNQLSWAAVNQNSITRLSRKKVYSHYHPQEAMNLYIHKTIKPHSCKIMWVHFFPLSDLSGWRHTKNNVCLHFGGGRTSRRWVWICQGLELEKGVLFCGFLRCSFFVCCSTSALGLLYYDYYNGCLIITMARERERGLPSSLFYDDPFAYISLAVNLIYWLQGVSGQDWKSQIAYYCNFFELPSPILTPIDRSSS